MSGRDSSGFEKNSHLLVDAWQLPSMMPSYPEAEAVDAR